MANSKALPAHLAALMACADAGELRRTRQGYTGVNGTTFHTTRTINDCENRRLLTFVNGQGETRLVPTKHGWEIARLIAEKLATGAKPTDVAQAVAHAA